MGELFLLALILWVAPMVVGANVWATKGGSPWVGALFGGALGWVGVVIAAVAKPDTQSRATFRAGDLVTNPRAIYGTGYEVLGGEEMQVISVQKGSVTVRLEDGTERAIPPSHLSLLVPEPDPLKTCPRCAEDIKAAARVCRFCGHEFDELTPSGA